MRIGIVQPVVQGWKWKERAEYARELVLGLKAEKPDVICLPELFPGEIDTLIECAPEVNSYIICGELRRHKSRQFSNNAVIIKPDGKILCRFSKSMLMPSEESFGYKPGSKLVLADTEFGRLGILICQDFPLAPETSGTLAMNGARIVFVLSMAVKSLLPYWQIFLKTRSIDNGIPTVFVNIGSEFESEGIIYGGGESSIILPMPKSVRNLKEFYYANRIEPEDQVVFKMDSKEGTAVVELDLYYHDTYRYEIQKVRSRAQSLML